jgi:hypothetical protein
MHPEVTSDKPGRCPKCHMKLVKTSEATSVHEPTDDSYRPLIVIILLILLVTGALAFRDLLTESFRWNTVMMHFMAGFFLTFSGFKLLDLKGFAEGYSMYDLFALRWFGYGFMYPFLELTLGLLYLVGFVPPVVTLFTLLLMLFSGIGVARKIMRHEKFQCACLGTFLKVPLTKVTLIEDFGMAFMAFLMFMLR